MSSGRRSRAGHRSSRQAHVGRRTLTLQELGDQFGISRERVRQLEARLHHKLRDYLKAELGDAVGSSH